MDDAPTGVEPKRSREILILLSAVVLPLLIIGAVGLAKRGPGATPTTASSNELSCRQGILALVSKVKEPMKIKLFTSKGQKKIDRAAAELDQTLREYASESKGKIQYRRQIVATDADEKQARELGLQPFAVESGDEDVVLSGYLGISLQYKTEAGSIPQLTPDGLSGMPFWLANKMRELTAKADGENIAIGVLSGSEEIGLSDPNLVPRQVGGGAPSINTILTQAFPFYVIRPIPASSGQDAVRDIRALVVTQPGRTLSEPELRLVDEFLMQGDRSLIVMASAVNVATGDRQMRAKLDRHGIERLLSGYGIDLENDVVFDPGAGLDVLSLDPGKKISFPTMPLVTGDERLDSNFAVFYRLDQLAFPLASTLTLHPERQPDAQLRAVAKTTDRAVSSTEQGLLVGPGAIVRAGTPKQRVLGAVLTGNIKSAFGDRHANGRLLVIASSAFPTNPFARARNPAEVGGAPTGTFEADPDPGLTRAAQYYAQRHLTSTILVVKSAFDWASSDERVIACSALIAPAKAPQKK